MEFPDLLSCILASLAAVLSMPATTKSESPIHLSKECANSKQVYILHWPPTRILSIELSILHSVRFRSS